ncbi:SIS domain-containing protein [Sciscionella marina]|uniref:SIS domain-containing protein n=1 Tax=Sciscionella marina TaxID=508770 RepID=UPI000371812A|nr:SIS domain-containing protein [Sciscionella marina]
MSAGVMALLDDALLDDPAKLAEVDRGGLLRAAAGAGAQVRATAEAAAETGIEDLHGSSPRALVLLTRPGASTDTARLVAALLGAACPIPVVAAEQAPSWIGPLDVVLASTDDPGDRELALSIDLAARRGASVVLAAPDEGPVAAAAAGKARLLPARVPMPHGFAFPRAVAAALATVRALGLFGTGEPDLLAVLADALDGEAERDQPGAESFVNPAKLLAQRLAGRTPLLWGTDPVATAVAAHAGSALAAHAGVVADVCDVRAVVERPALRAAALRDSSDTDIFADPEFDEIGTAPPVRPLLFTVAEDEATQQVSQAAERTFTGIDVLSSAEELTAQAGRHVGACAAMVLTVRLEFAAIYLGLATGVLGGEGTLAPSRV